MKEIGVTFEFLKDKKGNLNYKSLQGDQLRAALQKLDLRRFLEERQAAMCRDLWTEFLRIWTLIQKGKREDSQEIKFSAAAWWNLFISEPTGELNGEDWSPGLFTEEDATPYIHIFVEHAHQLVAKHGGLEIFCCDGLEKKGHLLQHFFWDQTMKGGGKQGNPIREVM